MHPFEDYLRQHNLEPLAVSIQARVRYLTVYNAMKGIPITPDHARKIRRAVFQMSGIPFTGSFALTQPPVDQLPTMPIRKLTRRS
jgi:hypothetical protein